MSDQKALAIKLAHIYYHTSSWEKAILEYEKILVMDPNDWGVRYTLGECLLKKGDAERAYKEFEISATGYMREKNIKKAANSYREMANIVQKLVEPQDVEKAKDQYREIITRLPDSEDAIRNLRDLFQRHNETAEAVKYTLRLGDLFNKLDYIDRAENEFIKVLAMDPQNAEAREKLDQLKKEKADEEAAAENEI